MVLKILLKQINGMNFVANIYYVFCGVLIIRLWHIMLPTRYTFHASDVAYIYYLASPTCYGHLGRVLGYLQSPQDGPQGEVE